MLLTIDIGNTNITFALFEGTQIKHQWRMISDAKKSEDDYAIDIIESILSGGFDAANSVSACIIASVVPDLSNKIKAAIGKFFSGKILLIGEENVRLDVEIALKNPQEVGADRLINAISGFKKFGGNLVIIDFGTATTFDIINENGAYLGGIIAAGINLTLKTLHEATAKLPRIELRKQENVIGKNTVEAMNSGVYFGYISMIEGLISRIESELNQQMKVILTGGLAPIFKDEIRNSHHEENLTLDGLRYVYERNHHNN